MHPAEQHEATDHRNGEDLAHPVLDGWPESRKSMTDTFRILRDRIIMEACAFVGADRAFQRRNERLRRIVETPGRKTT